MIGTWIDISGKGDRIKRYINGAYPGVTLELDRDDLLMPTVSEGEKARKDFVENYRRVTITGDTETLMRSVKLSKDNLDYSAITYLLFVAIGYREKMFEMVVNYKVKL